MLLANKVVAITGTGSGVGRAAAIRFAAEGAHVVAGDVNADWNRDTAELVSAGASGSITPVHCDVSNERDVVAMVALARESFGRIDVVYNNAGIASRRNDLPIGETDEAEYDRLMAVNAKGVFFGCK